MYFLSCHRARQSKNSKSAFPGCWTEAVSCKTLQEQANPFAHPQKAATSSAKYGIQPGQCCPSSSGRRGWRSHSQNQAGQVRAMKRTGRRSCCRNEIILRGLSTVPASPAQLPLKGKQEHDLWPSSAIKTSFCWKPQRNIAQSHRAHSHQHCLRSFPYPRFNPNSRDHKKISQPLVQEKHNNITPSPCSWGSAAGFSNVYGRHAAPCSWISRQPQMMLFQSLFLSPRKNWKIIAEKKAGREMQ